MSTLKVSYLIIFSMLSFLVSGQDRNTPFSTSNNYLSYRIGVGYPFFKEGTKPIPYAQGSPSYLFSNTGVNYALHGGFSLGHYFGNSFSIGLSPFLMYSKFASTDYHYIYVNNSTQSLLNERNGEWHYSHFGLLVPLEFAFHFKRNFNFAFGVFVLKPFTDLEYNTYIGIDYQYTPPKTYSPYKEVYKDRRSYYRSGIHGQFSFLLKARDWKETRIKLEYYHALTNANFQVYERWILIAFEKVFYQ
jgi:hypothetical protein